VRSAAQLPELAPLVGQVVLLELAVGTAAVSPGVDVAGRVGRGFVGTTALICALLMGIDLLLTAALPDPALLLGAPVDGGARAAAAHWAVAFTLLLIGAALFCAVGTDIARRVVGAVTCLAGMVGLVELAMAIGPALGGAGAASLAFLTGALLFGSALSGMLLGHWYLVAPTLSFKPLRQSVGLVFIAVAVELATVLGVIVTSDNNTRNTLTGHYGAPFWLLVVGSGVVFTALVNGLTYHFARIRANQPATAMLYVLIISVAMGVIPAHLLFFLTGAPL